MIEAEGITKLYGSRRALDGVSFRIEQGEVVGFLGLNGAGKTTVLKILSGVIWPSAGSVRIAGFDSRSSPGEIRRRVGFLPDRPPLYGDMSVRAMLAFAARLNGLAPRRVSQRVDEVIELCHLQAVRNDLVSWLSHGYRQRVGIAQAIVHEPDLLILDEPISGLDPEQIVGARNLVRSLGETYTVLVSSHILAEITHTCDRLLILHQGRIVAQGREQELLSELPRQPLALAGHGDAELALQLASTAAGIDAPRIQQRDGERFEIKLRADSDSACEALLDSLINHGIRIHRLAECAGGGLESVFLKLTRDAGP